MAAVMAIYRVDQNLACQTVATAIITMCGVSPTAETLSDVTEMLKSFADGVASCV